MELDCQGLKKGVKIEEKRKHFDIEKKNLGVLGGQNGEKGSVFSASPKFLAPNQSFLHVQIGEVPHFLAKTLFSSSFASEHQNLLRKSKN